MLKLGLAGISLFGLSSLISGQASAFCDHDQFTEPVANAYADYETQLFTDADPQALLAILDPILAMELNCFELGTIAFLKSSLLTTLEDDRAAAEAMETALEADYMLRSERRNALKALGELYYGFDKRAALRSFERWESAGGIPDVGESLRMANLYQDTGKYQKAFEYAEIAYREATFPDDKFAADDLMNAAQKRMLGQ
ncbi:MAG: hypothetical protein CMK07_10945 [Ponticaulis sp.]|nr:hypothetical protein [Ponticaulis sp.]